jgi:hypothetical protein
MVVLISLHGYMAPQVDGRKVSGCRFYLCHKSELSPRHHLQLPRQELRDSSEASLANGIADRNIRPGRRDDSTPVPRSLPPAHRIAPHTVYPHSSFDANAAPSASVRSFAQAMSGCTRPPRPQSVLASTFSRPTTLAKRTNLSATS